MRSNRNYQRQMRRARRRWGNQDAYPMLILGADEPTMAIALAALGRWLYRHRSAFLPFVISGAAFLAAIWMHAHHAQWFILVACVTLLAVLFTGLPHRLMWNTTETRFATGIFLRMWEACGIDRAPERIYVTAVIAALGIWMSVAIAIGPLISPLPHIAAIATLILGIPWWAHRRRRARVRIERTVQAWPDLAHNMGLPGSRIASAVGDAWGWSARLTLRKGTSVEDAIAKIPAIESGLGVRRGSVRVYPDNARADRATLRVIETDPHAEPIPWPGSHETSITQPAEIGITEDGQPVQVSFLRMHTLIGGTTGSGKSGIVNVILAHLAACRDVIIWGIDLKGGMELQPWTDVIQRLATTPQEAIQLMRDAATEVNHRAPQMAQAGKRVLDPDQETPALFIIVDEYAELPEEAHEYADTVARLGRAVAVSLLAATQRPSQDAMGKGAVRSQMDIRICLRVRERREVDLILGQGAFNAGWHAHNLTQPGAFLISSPAHTIPIRSRGYLISDDQVTHHARQHAHNRPRQTPVWPQRDSGWLHTASEWPLQAEQVAARGTYEETPESALWAALRAAGPQGASIADLMAASGMGRSWVYARLREHNQANRAVQVIPGSWRATATQNTQRPRDNRPPRRPRRRPR
jgi:S-DNA-T family DNA segregation ATPase FtsK/SpoIIIE